MTNHHRAFIYWLGGIAKYLEETHQVNLAQIFKEHPEFAAKSARLLYEVFHKGTPAEEFAEMLIPKKPPVSRPRHGGEYALFPARQIRQHRIQPGTQCPDCGEDIIWLQNMDRDQEDLGWPYRGCRNWVSCGYQETDPRFNEFEN